MDEKRCCNFCEQVLNLSMGKRRTLVTWRTIGTTSCTTIEMGRYNYEFCNGLSKVTYGAWYSLGYGGQIDEVYTYLAHAKYKLSRCFGTTIHWYYSKVTWSTLFDGVQLGCKIYFEILVELIERIGYWESHMYCISLLDRPVVRANYSNLGHVKSACLGFSWKSGKVLTTNWVLLQ